MPRDLVVGNGSLLVNLDRKLNIRDLYYPHVGLYNHVGGYRNRIGIWVDGQFSWLDETWSVSTRYKPGTLTTEAYASNGKLGVNLGFNDGVHPHFSLFLRKITVENIYPVEREFRLFLHHDFRIQESDIGDTVFYHPFSGSVIHYKRNYYILISLRAALRSLVVRKAHGVMLRMAL
jgi:GH15 family glucan-1,4-alpha-glucosidase